MSQILSKSGREPMGEIKQFDNAKERKSINDLGEHCLSALLFYPLTCIFPFSIRTADLYSIIKATETLEAAYSRGAAAPDEYSGTSIVICSDSSIVKIIISSLLL